MAAICAFPQPKMVKQLQSYLGMVNFYRKFLRSTAGILKPLTDYLCGAGGQAAKIQWAPTMDQAFTTSKEELEKATVLAHPGKHAKLALSVDASETHVRVALQQETRRGVLVPLGFFSKKLKPPRPGTPPSTGSC